MNRLKQNLPPAITNILIRFSKSIWLFPSILTIMLILLALLQISGSSIGAYEKILYGSYSSKNLILNKPELIRSDEWLVNSQATIAQKNNGFAMINKNIGNGEDVSLMNDVPYIGWSGVFRPQNIGYFLLPFSIAFSLHWWVMGYFLILGLYFFTIALLPKRRLLASLLGLSLFFSPFIQWWYTYGTLGSIYYPLFGAIVFIKLLKSTKLRDAILWSLLLAYIAVCFVLILYPPFQIPCALVVTLFLVGYTLWQRKLIDRRIFKTNLLFTCIAVLLALSIAGVFVYQKQDVIKAITNTAYPGKRDIRSGGYSLPHTLTGNLSPLFQSQSRSSSYLLTSINATNQSESSNFILLLPFLVIPILCLGYKKYKRKKHLDYTLVGLTAALLIFLAWLFVPGMKALGVVTLLNKVPQQRMLIGLGLLSFVFIIWFIKLYSETKKRLSLSDSIIYSLIVFIIYLLLDFGIVLKFPNFIGYNFAILLALPIPVIIFCLMRKYFTLGIGLFLLLSIASTFAINPLYRGTDILTKTPLIQAIQTIGSNSNKKWVVEASGATDNFATMAGKPSLSGVYTYPQLQLWKQVAKPSQQYIYNRFAHVNFIFDRGSKQTKPLLTLVQQDDFSINIEPCDNFLKNQNVGFLVTSQKFTTSEASCAQLDRSVAYPMVTYYIYKLNF